MIAGLLLPDPIVVQLLIIFFSLCFLERLVEIRTVMERMRPIEHKLKYQVEKLLKIVTAGKLGDADPLQFKANPGNLMGKVVWNLELNGPCKLKTWTIFFFRLVMMTNLLKKRKTMTRK